MRSLTDAVLSWWSSRDRVDSSGRNHSIEKRQTKAHSYSFIQTYSFVGVQIPPCTLQAIVDVTL
eukprot:5292636-Pyramimonas_sp.AAC.1